MLDRLSNKILECNNLFSALITDYVVLSDRKQFIPFDDLVADFRLRFTVFTKRVYDNNKVDSEMVNNFFNTFFAFLDNVYIVKTSLDIYSCYWYTDLLKERFGEVIDGKERDEYYYKFYEEVGFLVNSADTLTPFKLVLKSWHGQLLLNADVKNFKNIEQQMNSIFYIALGYFDYLDGIFNECNEARKKVESVLDGMYLSNATLFESVFFKDNVPLLLKTEYRFIDLKNYFKEKFMFGFEYFYSVREYSALEKYMFSFYSIILIDLEKNITYIPDSINKSEEYSEIISGIKFLLNNINSYPSEVRNSRFKLVHYLVRDMFCFLYEFF